MKKNNKKEKNIHKKLFREGIVLNILISIFTLFSIACFVGLYFQDSYIFYSFSEYWQKLQQCSSCDRNTIFSVYYTILLGVLGIIFTSLSIHLSNKEIGINSFFKDIFFSYKANIILVAVILINSSVILFSGQLRYTTLLNLYIIFSIFPIVFFFFLVVKMFNATERCEFSIDFLVHNLLRAKSSNNYLLLLITTDPDNFVTLLLSSLERIKLKCVNDYDVNKKIINKIFINLDLLKPTLEKNTIYLRVLVKLFCKIQIFLFENNFDLDIKEKNLRSVFIYYKNYIFNRELDTSFLLEIKEPSYYYYFKVKDVINDNELEEFAKYYVHLMVCSKEIIITSLYYLKKETVQSEINDFIAMIQFMDMNQNLRNLSERKGRALNVVSQNYKLTIDILTWIINLIVIKRIDKSYLDFIVPLYTHVLEILTFDIDDTMYDEPFRPIGVYEVEYTRNFFIALIIIYLNKKQSVSLSEIMNKLRYSSINQIKYHDRDDLILLLHEINKITEKHSKELSILDIGNDLDDIKKAFQNEIKSKYENYLSELSSLDVTSIIEDELNSLIENTKNVLKEYVKGKIIGEIETKQNHMYISVNFSKRQLTEDSSIIGLGSLHYEEFIINTLYSQYCRKANTISILNLDKIEISKDETLLIPSVYMEYLYSAYPLFWKEKCINLYGHNVSIKIIRTDLKFIVLLSDLCEYIWIPNDGIQTVKDENGYSHQEIKKRLSIDDKSQVFDIDVNCKIDITVQQYKDKIHNVYQLVI